MTDRACGAHRKGVEVQGPEVVMHCVALAPVLLVHCHCVAGVEVQPVAMQRQLAATWTEATDHDSLVHGDLCACPDLPKTLSPPFQSAGRLVSICVTLLLAANSWALCPAQPCSTQEQTYRKQLLLQHTGC